MSPLKGPRAVDLLRPLLAEHGIERYAPFLVQQEGKMLPGGVEAISGFVLTPTGEVYGFWLDWDEVNRRYALEPWYRVNDVSEFEADAEYQKAKQSLIDAGTRGRGDAGQDERLPGRGDAAAD